MLREIGHRCEGVRDVSKKLNIGCGRNILSEWINVDYAVLPGVDVVYDLERCAEAPLPLENDSVDEFLLSHVIEHLHHTLPLMQELHRVAKAGAKAVIRVPHGASDDAWEDPTHLRGYFQSSFGYFSQPFYWRADYNYRGDWQVEQLHLIVARQVYAGMSAAAIMKEVANRRNVVQEMVADLRAVKPIRQPLRELQVPPRIEILLA
jgi:SAM-dependent methyltransferase